MVPPYKTNYRVERVAADAGGLPPIVLWIIIGCVGGVAVIAAIVGAVIVYHRRNANKDQEPANR